MESATLDPPAAAPEIDPEFTVPGTASQLSFDVGGEKPTGSKITIVGGQRDVEGQFKKGQTFTATVTFRVGAVEFADVYDKETDQVVDSVRRHKARIVGFQRH